MLRPNEDTLPQVSGPVMMIILLQADLPSPSTAPVSLVAAAGRWFQQNQRINLIGQVSTINERRGKPQEPLGIELIGPVTGWCGAARESSSTLRFVHILHWSR
jgi:hypothetical protein